MAESQDSFSDVSRYYVSLLDLMGQKAFFGKIQSTDIDEETNRNVRRITDGLREIIKYVQSRYERMFVEEDDVGVELFSDSIMLSIKQRDEIDMLRIRMFLDIIIKVIYIAFRHRLPVRGGISLGYACRSSSGMLYGPVVEKAMAIESKTADYPRVVIDNSLADYLLQSPYIAEVLCVDSDSSVILNYAGEKVLRCLEFNRECVEMEDIIKWVKEWYAHFCFPPDADGIVEPNPKLARRYVMWLEYLCIERDRCLHGS